MPPTGRVPGGLADDVDLEDEDDADVDRRQRQHRNHPRVSREQHGAVRVPLDVSPICDIALRESVEVFYSFTLLFIRGLTTIGA